MSLALIIVVPDTDAAEVTTDKPDYMPRSTAVFSGSGFQSGEDVELHVTFANGEEMPDGEAKWQVTTDVAGAFTTTWTVCNCPDTSLLLTVTGKTSGIVATANFTDGAVNLDQFKNGSAASPEAEWINGNLNENQAHYAEGYSIPYRVLLAIPDEILALDDDDPNKVVCLTLAYDVKHSGKHALDYITHYQNIDHPSHSDGYGHDQEMIDPVAGVAGYAANAVADDTVPVDVPGHNNIIVLGESQPAVSFAELSADKVVSLWGGQFIRLGDGVTLDPEAFTYNDEDGDPDGVDLNAAQSEQKFTIKFVPNAETVVLAWGGHIGHRDDWGETDGEANSASGINGSPYHMRVIDWNLGNLGNQDRSTNAGVVEDSPPPPEVMTTFLHVCEGSGGSVALELDTAIVDFYPGAADEWKVIDFIDPLDVPFLKGDTTFDPAYTGPDLVVDPGSDDGKIQIGAFVDGVDLPIQDFLITVYPSPPCAISGSDSLCLGSVSELYTSGEVSGVDPFPGDRFDQLVEISYDWQVIAGSASINGVADQASVDVDSSSVECGNTFTLQLTVTKRYYLQPFGPGTAEEDLTTCTSTCTKVVTVDDTIAPVLVGCPSDISVQCIVDLPSGIGVVTATDACGVNVPVPVAVSYQQVLVSGTGNGCGDVYLRTWSATDDCGNTSSCSQRITVIDTVNPVLVGCPDDITVECLSNVPGPANVTASDNCDPSPQVSLVEIRESGDGTGCGDVYLRTWTATDSCGNTSSCSQRITVIDTIDPILLDCPDDTTVNSILGILIPSNVTATDNCDSNPVVTMTQTPTDLSTVACGGLVVRTWTATDNCGNTASCSQTITIADNTGPQLSSYPADFTVECGVTVLSLPEILTATDDRDIDLAVVYSEDLSGLGGSDCSGVIKRIWTVTDSCGLVDTHTQTISIVDNTPPSIVSVGAEHEAACVIEGDLSDISDGDVISLVTLCKCLTDDFVWGDVQVFDDCGDANVSVTDVGPIVITKEYGEQKLYTRTIEVGDGCGNTMTVTVNVYLPVCPLTYLSLTQGGWSAPKKKKAGNGNNDKTNGKLRDLIVEELLTKYGPLWIGKEDGNYVKVETDERKYLRVLLPSGGPAAPLPDGTMVDGVSDDIDEMSPLLNRNGRFANVLIGQYVALQLNVWLNDCPEAAGEPLMELDSLGDHVLTPEWCSIPAGAFRKCGILSPEEINEYFHSLNVMMGAVDQEILDALETESLPNTVNGLLELTRRYLAGHSAGGVKGSDLVSALSSFNEGFSGGRIWIDPILCECLQNGGS